MLCILKLDYEGKIDGFMMGVDFGELSRRAESNGLHDLAHNLYLRESPMEPRKGNHGIIFTDANAFDYQLLVD